LYKIDTIFTVMTFERDERSFHGFAHDDAHASKRFMMMMNPRSLPDNRPSVENIPESTYRDEVWKKHCELGLGLHEPNAK
jgi:hypothetical protein